jgi:hypothetical protein
MSSLDVTIVPACDECAARWLPGDPERWRAELLDDRPDDGLKFWCPQCWQRELVRRESDGRQRRDRQDLAEPRKVDRDTEEPPGPDIVNVHAAVRELQDAVVRLAEEIDRRDQQAGS